MAVRFSRSATRHGISRARAAWVIEHCRNPFFAAADPGPGDAILFLGFDPGGIPIEVLGVELPGGDLLVIHAMRMQRRYTEAFRRVVRWDES